MPRPTVVSLRADLEHQIRVATRALLRMEQIPDPASWPNETVVLWYERLDDTGVTYTYVAVKVLNRWYTTSRYNSVLLSPELWERLTADSVLEVWIAAEWHRVDSRDEEDE